MRKGLPATGPVRKSGYGAGLGRIRRAIKIKPLLLDYLLAPRCE